MIKLTGKSIIVTGGAGFIGSHVVDVLLSMGANVTIIDNYSTGRKSNNKPHSRLNIIEGSITSSELVYTIFDLVKPELVIHTAAAYKNPLDWTEDLQTNGQGTINIIRAGQLAGIKRIIYLQTSLCYGLFPAEVPIRLGNAYFSGGYRGGSSYAISKTIGELYLELSGLDFVSFRLANTYGPRNLTGPLPAFFRNLVTRQESIITDTRRDFIYVSDVVAAIILAAEGVVKSGYFHLSTGIETSIKDLFELTKKHLAVDHETRFTTQSRGSDDAETIWIKPSDKDDGLPWKAKVSLEQGIEKTMNYYNRTGVGNTYTHLKGIE